MRNDFRSYSSIGKGGPKLEGKFNVAFGEFPKLSSFTLNYGDGSKYDFGSSGSMTRNRRNDHNDLRTDAAIAREASRLLKDSEFVRKSVKEMQDKKYNISTKDVKTFAEGIEKHYAIHERDGLTSKLMGGS
jgi:hypothetical protein